eukprot:UN24882
MFLGRHVTRVTARESSIPKAVFFFLGQPLTDFSEIKDSGKTKLLTGIIHNTFTNTGRSIFEIFSRLPVIFHFF